MENQLECAGIARIIALCDVLEHCQYVGSADTGCATRDAGSASLELLHAIQRTAMKAPTTAALRNLVVSNTSPCIGYRKTLA
jgi:hypothetical protein